MTGTGRRPIALLTAVAALGLPLAAAESKPKPPKPPKPEITLKTKTEEAALQRGSIKVLVEAKRAKKVTVSADFVVDGYPDDFFFELGPKRERVKQGTAKVKFPLSSRQKEVLDFAIKSCRGASLAIVAKTKQRTGKLDEELALPSDC